VITNFNRKSNAEKKVSRIARVETFIVGVPAPYLGGLNWVFVKLTTNDGVVGWGECNACTFREKSVVAIVQEVAEHFLIGRQNPFDIEQLWMDLYSGDQTPLVKSFTNYRPAGALAMQAVAAIEMACWDIVGKVLGQPVYNLLGGKCRMTLRSYSYLPGWAAGEPPERAGEAAAAAVEHGFTAIKLDPIPPYFPQSRPIELGELDYTEKVLAAIRATVGNRCDILVGTHGQLSTHSAIRFAKVIEPFSPFWFEEPVPPENCREMARVASSTSVPVATGERLSTKWDFHRVLESQAAQIVQPNVGLNGILESKKIAAIAEAHYAHVAPWIYCGPVAACASMQLDMCTPNFLIQESIRDWSGFAAEIMHQPIVWKDGYLHPPSVPGLGADLREDVLLKHPMHEYSQISRTGSIDLHVNTAAQLNRQQLRMRSPLEEETIR
jgi:2-dehydro-3-deoxyphosphogalactonate aldolase